MPTQKGRVVEEVAPVGDDTTTTEQERLAAAREAAREAAVDEDVANGNW